MDPSRMFDALGLSGSGMAAERERMELVAQNLAHAQNTNRGDGTPYRRREAVFETVLDGAEKGQVRLRGVVEDVRSPVVRVRQPGHPDADREGFVSYPNVNPVFEMADLLASSRAYEANLKAAQIYKQMVEQTLALGR